MVQLVLGQPKIPPTISGSYGDEEHELPLEYKAGLCNLFAPLGARGVSVLVATGNDGVGAGDCEDDEERLRFAPLFPATCTRSMLSIHTSSTQPQIQVDHQIVMVSQASGSLASVA